MKYTPEEILDKIQEIIVHYNNNRGKISDQELEDLRAYLSVGTYLLVETNIQPAYADVTLTEVELERAEGTVFKEHFMKFRDEKYSASIAMDLARKATKCDERYLDALKQASTAKQTSYLLSKILDQANQVLNSMSKKTRV